MLFVYSTIVLLTFIAMEGVAWWAHKYVMHGPMWWFHRDHHQREDGFFERNDVFALIFAIPSWLCIMLGMMAENYSAVSVGAGIAAYGLAYLFVHDIFIHQRVKWMKTTDHPYFYAIRREHYKHHTHVERHDGECFGMLWVRPSRVKEAKNRLERNRNRNLRETE
ncbi:MAG: carotene hydroxylase [Opitutales bacterium]